MNEEWKPIAGSNGKYLISNMGRVASTKYSAEPRLLSTYLDGRYVRVTLHINKKHTKPLVHVLVAETFIGPKPQGKEVNHIDGNKANNTLPNLEYLTPAENTQHATATGLHVPLKGEKHGGAKLTATDVRTIRSLYDSNQKNCAELSRQYNVTLQQIWKIVKRTAWKSVV